MMHGWCQKGDDCTFAHGTHELHPDVRPQQFPGKGGKGWQYDDASYSTKLDRNRVVDRRMEDSMKEWSHSEGFKKRSRGRGGGQSGDSKQEQRPKSTFNEEMYTTKLDMGNISKEKQEEADRIAREIVREIEASRKANPTKASPEVKQDKEDDAVQDQETKGAAGEALNSEEPDKTEVAASVGNAQAAPVVEEESTTPVAAPKDDEAT